MPKKSQHVVPNQMGGWSVRKAGAPRATRRFETQQDAIKYARGLAQKEHAELYVHRKDGTIRQKDSYGGDPHPPKDKK